MRQSNAIQLSWFYENGSYASREDLLGSKGIQAHREHFVPGTLAYAWMSRMNFFSDAVLPGWTLDFAIITTKYPRNLRGKDGPIPINNGYRLIMYGKDYTFVTDEVGIIYRARTPENPPVASALDDAASFPGATTHNLPPAETPTVWQRIKDFLTPTAYAQLSCCTSHQSCHNCGCCNCVFSCCDGCVDFVPPPGRCYFNAGCSGCILGDCVWVENTCGRKDCNCCAKLLGGCCVSTGCTPGCPQC